jgi:hypothetical protein
MRVRLLLVHACRWPAQPDAVRPPRMESQTRMKPTGRAVLCCGLLRRGLDDGRHGADAQDRVDSPARQDEMLEGTDGPYVHDSRTWRLPARRTSSRTWLAKVNVSDEESCGSGDPYGTHPTTEAFLTRGPTRAHQLDLRSGRNTATNASLTNALLAVWRCMDAAMETARSQGREVRARRRPRSSAEIIVRSEGGRDARRYHRAGRSLGPDSERL